MIHVLITAIPERLKLVKVLQESLQAENLKTNILWDREHTGPWPTTRRALTFTTDEHLLILQDDTQITPDFSENLYRLIEADPACIYALYSGKWYETKTASLPRPALWTMRGGLNGAAILLPRAQAQRCALWNDKHLKKGKRSSDLRIWLAADALGIPVRHTKPELVQHLGSQISSIGYNTPNQVAADLNSEGNVYDWSQAPIKEIAALPGNTRIMERFLQTYSIQPESPNVHQ